MALSSSSTSSFLDFYLLPWSTLSGLFLAALTAKWFYYEKRALIVNFFVDDVTKCAIFGFSCETLWKLTFSYIYCAMGSQVWWKLIATSSSCVRFLSPGGCPKNLSDSDQINAKQNCQTPCLEWLYLVFYVFCQHSSHKEAITISDTR